MRVCVGVGVCLEVRGVEVGTHWGFPTGEELYVPTHPSATILEPQSLVVFLNPKLSLIPFVVLLPHPLFYHRFVSVTTIHHNSPKFTTIHHNSPQFTTNSPHCLTTLCVSVIHFLHYLIPTWTPLDIFTPFLTRPLVSLFVG